MKELSARKFGWSTLLLVLILAGSVRYGLREIPLERDEGEYAYAGQLMLQGVPPYQEVSNMKIPGIYAAYAVGMAVFGQSRQGVHTALLVINLLTIITVFLLARQLMDRLGAVYIICVTLGKRPVPWRELLLQATVYLSGFMSVLLGLVLIMFWTGVFSPVHLPGFLLSPALLSPAAALCEPVDRGRHQLTGRTPGPFLSTDPNLRLVPFAACRLSGPQFVRPTQAFVRHDPV